jgi:tryptophanyl-tRNA synthetase
MSSSDPNSTIFLTDTPAQIKNKIKKHAFSGAPKSLEELKEKGCNLKIDVPYNYLRFFLEDDEELAHIGYTDI